MIADAGPTSPQTLLAFVAFVVPGFLLRCGYKKARYRGAVETDLYALAEAVVGSALVLAVAWWFGGREIVGWANTGTLAPHAQRMYWIVVGLLIAPFPVGMMLGWLVTGATVLLEKGR